MQPSKIVESNEAGTFQTDFENFDLILCITMNKNYSITSFFNSTHKLKRLLESKYAKSRNLEV